MKKELFNALERDDFDTVKDLFAQDFRVLLDVTFQGDTPLHIAARQGHRAIVVWILQVKSSLAGARNNNNCMPPHEAAKCGKAYLVEILLQQKKSCAFHYNKFGETPLVIACKYGHKETVELLLQANSNNNAIGWYRSIREAAYREYTGTTSHLHAAVNGRNLEIVKAILDDSAWHNDLMTKKDKYGRCAVHVAAMKGLSDITAEFMSRMPDCLEIRASDQKSVLHIAVECNQTEIVRNILANRGEEKVKELVSRDHDVFHNTALHLAAINGVDLQLLEHLLPFPGVDVNALNDEGMSAVDIASATAQHNTNCSIIVEKLVHTGAIRSSVIPKPNTTCAPCYGSFRRKERDSADLHMVVASLIATVTFAAIFQVPGGIEDNRGSIQYGGARMAHHKLFKLFILSDTAALTTSLIVVVAWLLRQQLPDSFPSVVSHLSEVSLPVSIVWTIVAFTSATIIIITPRNFEILKIKNKKAFLKYNSLLQYVVFLASVPPLHVLSMFLATMAQIIMSKKFNSFSGAKVIISISVQLFIVTIFIIYATLI